MIASVEVANSKKINLQATGSIPNIQLDNVNGATIYLTNDNKAGVEIITCSGTRSRSSTSPSSSAASS